MGIKIHEKIFKLNTNKNKMEYNVIDYKKWDFSGQGKNLTNLLTREEFDLWNQALPHQDKRNDKGHAETVTYFAVKFLELIGGERNIIIPAAILHDTGWSQMTATELNLFNEMIPNPDIKDYEPVLRQRHQKEAVKLAGKLLPNAGYKENIPHILEIISQHDTRKGFYSKEDGVVRDADKLWRFTLQHWLSFLERKWSFEDFKKNYDDMQKQGYFASPVSKQVAELEYAHTLKEIEKTK